MRDNLEQRNVDEPDKGMNLNEGCGNGGGAIDRNIDGANERNSG